MMSFVIMNIGNPTLEPLWHNVMKPILAAEVGAEPLRVDKHNRGGMIPNKIVEYIEAADIILADLTNERPNCYLEVGYAMAFYRWSTGVAEYPRLILAAREDHDPRRLGRNEGDPKVHFDLDTYDILFWKDETDYREKLTRRIRERLKVIGALRSPSTPVPVVLFDEDWIFEHRTLAGGVESLKGVFDAFVALGPTKPTLPHKPLQEALGRNVGRNWPIAFIPDSGQEVAKMRPDGVVAKWNHPPEYSYLALRTNGDLYLARNYIEDTEGDRGMKPGERFACDARVFDAVALLRYLTDLYLALGVSDSAEVHVRMRHSGLMNRKIGALSPFLFTPLVDHYTATVSDVDTGIDVTLADLAADDDAALLGMVKTLLDRVFLMFDGFEVSDRVYLDAIGKRSRRPR